MFHNHYSLCTIKVYSFYTLYCLKTKISLQSRIKIRIDSELKEYYHRRTDNTMAKRKSTKGQTTISKHTYKTKDRVTQTALKTGGELGCSGRFSISCSTSGTRRVFLVTNPVISHEQEPVVQYLPCQYEVDLPVSLLSFT